MSGEKAKLSPLKKYIDPISAGKKLYYKKIIQLHDICKPGGFPNYLYQLVFRGPGAGGFRAERLRAGGATPPQSLQARAAAQDRTPPFYNQQYQFCDPNVFQPAQNPNLHDFT